MRYTEIAALHHLGDAVAGFYCRHIIHFSSGAAYIMAAYIKMMMMMVVLMMMDDDDMHMAARVQYTVLLA